MLTRCPWIRLSWQSMAEPLGASDPLMAVSTKLICAALTAMAAPDSPALAPCTLDRWTWTMLLVCFVLYPFAQLCRLRVRLQVAGLQLCGLRLRLHVQVQAVQVEVAARRFAALVLVCKLYSI